MITALKAEEKYTLILIILITMICYDQLKDPDEGVSNWDNRWQSLRSQAGLQSHYHRQGICSIYFYVTLLCQEKQEIDDMLFGLSAIFLIQKNKWKWLLKWTPPWYPSVWPFAKLWPTRARPSISSSPTPLSPSPWTPRGSMRNPLWIRRGSALLHRGGMQEGERSFWKRSSTLSHLHHLLRTLQQVVLQLQHLWRLQLQHHSPQPPQLGLYQLQLQLQPLDPQYHQWAGNLAEEPGAIMTAHQTSEGGQKPLIPMQRGTVALDGFGEEEYATTTPWLVETAVPLTILNRYDFRGEGSR